ncbi:hypothetical protein PInf_017341 [Phytophthora infestans]|nr:hypothetical protein PInf_017341 [Phytophthora infestans]
MSEAKDSVVALLVRNWSSSEEDSKDHSDAIAVGDAQAMVPASLNTPSIRRLPTQRIFGEGFEDLKRQLNLMAVEDVPSKSCLTILYKTCIPVQGINFTRNGLLLRYFNALQRANQSRKPQSIQNWV